MTNTGQELGQVVKTAISKAKEYIFKFKEYSKPNTCLDNLANIMFYLFAHVLNKAYTCEYCLLTGSVLSVLSGTIVLEDIHFPKGCLPLEDILPEMKFCSQRCVYPLREHDQRLCFCETGTYYVCQASYEFIIFLFEPLECITTPGKPEMFSAYQFVQPLCI